MTPSKTVPALSLAACLALAAPFAAHAADKLAHGDASFVKKAGADGMTEVELGKLAQQKASSDAVKQFGKRMEDDHSKANDKLKSLASAKGVELPAPDKKDVSKLQDKSGADFDRDYMKHMVSDHKKDISAFEKAAKSKDPEVKAFASETLPTLQEHYKLAQQTYDSVKSGRGKGEAKK